MCVLVCVCLCVCVHEAVVFLRPGSISVVLCTYRACGVCERA